MVSKLRALFKGTRNTFIASCAIALLIGTSVSPAQAANSDKGLYGTTDPTYSAVYNQSLAILGLDSIGVGANRAAMTWLVNQQCADGGFQAYRPDTAIPCDAPDPENFTGPSTDQTALAALALNTQGKFVESKKALTWLKRVATKDAQGLTGLPTIQGGAPDAIATALGYLVINDAAPTSALAKSLRAYLSALITPCGQERGGAAAYSNEVPGANNSATANVYFGLKGNVPVWTAGKLKANPRCGANKTTRLGSYLANQMSTDGLLSYYPYDGNDFGATAATVISLGMAGYGKQSVAKGLAALKKNTKSWALKDFQTNAGAIGWLMMVGKSTGTNPKKFGGVNLVSTLLASQK